MSIDELINLIINLAVDNYDMRAPQFAKLLKDNIIDIFKQREQEQKANEDSNSQFSVRRGDRHSADGTGTDTEEMITKTNQEYLDMLKSLAKNGEVHKNTVQLAKAFMLSESHTRNVLMILLANGSIEVLKNGKYITGVKLN